MQEDLKKSERNQALIGILTRLADEMQDQDNMLADVIEKQSDIAKSLEQTGQYIRRRQSENDEAHSKLSESFHHYRSDMLRLVNEQDIINRNIADLQNVVKTTTFTLDGTNRMLTGLDERLSRHEKKTEEQAEHAIKQQKFLQDAINEISRDFTKLHADTEKRTKELHRETAERLDSFQHETARRLLLLDSIVNSIETLLARTDPELKRKPWIVRLFNKISKFFRFKLPYLLKNMKRK